MDYQEGIIKNTEFLTTSELAKKLKMNVQVITRKVQSGEIYAYKIGKDWRIPEQAVFEWLNRHSNKKNETTKPEASDTITELKPVNRLKKIETLKDKSEAVVTEKKPSVRRHLLEYILAQFEPNKLYTEAEVDRIINRFDSNTNEIRSEFLKETMLELSGGKYRRSNKYSLANK